MRAIYICPHAAAARFGLRAVELRAGKKKNTLSALGPVTKEGIDNTKRQMERIHAAFAEHVELHRGGPKNSRPSPPPQSMSSLFSSSNSAAGEDEEDVANGDVWLGREAAQKGLADLVMTSDEYLQNCMHTGDGLSP